MLSCAATLCIAKDASPCASRRRPGNRGEFRAKVVELLKERPDARVRMGLAGELRAAGLARQGGRGSR